MDPNLQFKILYIAGITNILFLLLVFFSCRCIMGPKLAKFFTSKKWFQKLYRWHCWFWWAFFLSVI